MHSKGISLKVVAFVCVLKTSRCILAVEKGQDVHNTICKHGLEHDLVISNMLIVMNAKFGLLDIAQVVFLPCFRSICSRLAILNFTIVIRYWIVINIKKCNMFVSLHQSLIIFAT